MHKIVLSNLMIYCAIFRTIKIKKPTMNKATQSLYMDANLLENAKASRQYIWKEIIRINCNIRFLIIRWVLLRALWDIQFSKSFLRNICSTSLYREGVPIPDTPTSILDSDTSLDTYQTCIQHFSYVLSIISYIF